MVMNRLAKMLEINASACVSHWANVRVQFVYVHVCLTYVSLRSMCVSRVGRLSLVRVRVCRIAAGSRLSLLGS
jgi:hypothetical protein